MSLKVYFDFMSQPCRALLIFLQNCSIPYEKCPIAIRNSEHLTDYFKNEVSRFQQIPTIQHGNIKLSESVAIVRYLSREFQIDNNWYPRDSKLQAKVDEYLEWQHVGLRDPCTTYFQVKIGRQLPREEPSKLEERMIQAIDNFERLWLANNPYITGNQISVADIFAACELEQPRFIGYNPVDSRPALSQWINNVRNAPHYAEVHTVFNNLRQRMAKKLSGT